jgi:hypothetical protein
VLYVFCMGANEFFDITEYVRFRGDFWCVRYTLGGVSPLHLQPEAGILGHIGQNIATK